VLSCSNLPIWIHRDEIRFAGEVVSASGLLDKLQQELNSCIEKMRENGSPLTEVTDLVILTDIIVEKELDRPVDILVYLLAREGCSVNSTVFDGLRGIVLGLARNELTEQHLFEAYLRAVFPTDWLRTYRRDQEPGESSCVHAVDARTGSEMSSQGPRPGNEVTKDRRRPIMVDGENAGIGRLDTGPLRELQQKLNAYIDRICSAKNTGNQVFETYVFLEHLLETEFYSRESDCIYSPRYVELLAAADAAGVKNRDVGDVLVELSSIADCVAAGMLSVDDLTQFRRSISTDRQPSSSPTD
jgi:hypothetical protein